MSKRIGKREAFRLAVMNAAAIVDREDLEAFYGEEVASPELDDTQDEILAEAKSKVVERIRRMAME